MTAEIRADAVTDADISTVILDVVVPVYNEERDLAASVDRVLDHLATCRGPTASRSPTTRAPTPRRSSPAAGPHPPHVEVVHLAEKAAGGRSSGCGPGPDAAVLVYMDVDLSTDLNALLPWWHPHQRPPPTWRSAPASHAAPGCTGA